ncbi:hypothetical protein PR048_022701 [Dryococelus australis]|uniref:Uncharacterized protein n=1 Tax=Dryococelus australis TaxID=614101 RepID=A0ABQ9GS06_9NEOP|nr:hypothetical protein PR048_022701 [Dryococelus australis]
MNASTQIKSLQDIMSGISEKKETYSDKHLKNHILENFKEHIMICNVFGRKNIMCLSYTAHKITDNSNLETEKLRIVLAAADINKTFKKWCMKVTEKKKNTSELENLKRKCVGINHAIISAVRPRSFLSQLQIGLAFTLHRLYGSKHLINM